MAWYSHTVAVAVPMTELGDEADPRVIVQQRTGTHRYVYASSRNGSLLATLKSIWTHSRCRRDVYLFNASAVLAGPEINDAGDSIQEVLSRIEEDPEIVVEGTKAPHRATTDIQAQGFRPLRAEIVYPTSATIKDGWVYYYTRDDVHSRLATAMSSSDPRPRHDDDGESLEYVFGFLKSHLSLLRFAAASQLAFVYAELG